ncbi:helix-turn-helix domain containing protein [Pseudooceanicola antarcticus]|uniref:Helix-turn-helix domain containing protein n=1 Tax=Pseudooceanicola antarcticus TaxID=1247613 RepID=A0ABX4MHW3_9RHOB|nr:helix-turn-helix domain containing protein [Pseudooceanicola antarcticus]
MLRQIRRFETLRDDLLVDCALSRLGREGCDRAVSARSGQTEDGSTMKTVAREDLDTPITETILRRDALPVLRHLARPGTVLAVAQDMDKAVVVRDRIDGSPDRLDVVSRQLAEAMALKDWISCKSTGRVARYSITSQGRATLNTLIAKSENAARGFAEGMARFETDEEGEAGDGAEEAFRGRGWATDTPVAALARRRDRDGQPFLRPELVRAGERLREDFELSQMGPRVTQDWDRFMTAGVSDGSGGQPSGPLRGAEAARARVSEALRNLGPGLADVALRCCCHLEGLETAERKMGWSARSGKIVLRIALERLHRHYQELPQESRMIG